MPRHPALVAPLEHLLHPINIRSGAISALSWKSIPKGPKAHFFGQTERALAGVLLGEGEKNQVPASIAGVTWRRGWTIAIPLIGGLRFDDQRIDPQELVIIPPGSNEESLELDSSAVVLFFHPGPHADQRASSIRGSLDALVHPISVNRRRLSQVEKDGLDGGAVAYKLPLSGDDHVDVSVLNVPSSSRNERHIHGTRGELSLLLGTSGLVTIGEESLRPSSFDLEGPRTRHELRVLEECWALQVSLDGVELQEH